jgi:myo-inositol 2-dehydrogenase/D-chiro-inositol 1-dehydrogenase
MSLAVGVIGTGVMGAEHARLLRCATSGAHLAAVCDPDAARATTAAQGAAVFTDAHALIHSDKAQAVVIALPDATHADYALACLAVGKPVLCEKPIAATEGWAIVQAEDALGRRLVTVGFMRRFDPAYTEMRAARASGRLGYAVLLHNMHRNAEPRRNGSPGPMHAAYGYHVHAQLVGRRGTVEMASPSRVLTNLTATQSFDFPSNWVPRFTEAYRLQMQAWDGFVTTSIAGQIVRHLGQPDPIALRFPPRPALYA